MSRGNHCGSTSELGLNEGEKWNMVPKLSWLRFEIEGLRRGCDEGTGHVP